MDRAHGLLLVLTLLATSAATDVCPKSTVHGARLGDNDGDLDMKEQDPGLDPPAYDIGDEELYLKKDDRLPLLPTNDDGLSVDGWPRR